jgi:kinetochore protein Mis13/DSN1
LNAARVIQEELSIDLISNGLLSDWFSRDESVTPQIPLKKKANPRNIANAAKAEELERELERYGRHAVNLCSRMLTNQCRLKRERAEWDEVVQSAASATSQAEECQSIGDGGVSPLRPDLLDSPQRAIFERLDCNTADFSTEPDAIQTRLRTISDDLEFTVDMFAHGVHALSTTRDTADRVAEKSLKDAADALEERERQRAASGKSLDQMNVLRGLARILNAQQKRS